MEEVFMALIPNRDTCKSPLNYFDHLNHVSYAYAPTGTPTMLSDVWSDFRVVLCTARGWTWWPLGVPSHGGQTQEKAAQRDCGNFVIGDSQNLTSHSPGHLCPVVLAWKPLHDLQKSLPSCILCQSLVPKLCGCFQTASMHTCAISQTIYKNCSGESRLTRVKAMPLALAKISQGRRPSSWTLEWFKWINTVFKNRGIKYKHGK